MKKLYAFIFLLLIFTAVKSQYVKKITSINYYGYNGLNPTDITVFNNKLYFFGTDDPHYVDKLMFTDGTEAGVTVVMQIDTIKQYPSLRHLTILNNLLIFDNYYQLWKSDGTTAGTSSLADIKTGTGNYAVLNNKVYFAADGTNSSPINDQLWQTDGTPGGTSLLKTINPTGAAHIFNLFSYGGKIYFGADSGTLSGQLWVSDGTPAGTKLLKVINPASTAFPNYFVGYNGKVYFSAIDNVSGDQLWVTDGTNAGTLKVTNINAGSTGLYPSIFTQYNSKLFFMGIDTVNYYQLWATDGTTAGTVKIKTDYTPSGGATGFMPNSMAIHNNMLYMAGHDSVSGTTQLWVSDGTTAGTTKVTSFTHSLYPSKLFSFQNKLIMTGGDTISQEEQLFASDGTAAGTVCPTPPDTWGQYPFYPWEAWVPFNNALYFKAAYAYFADYQLCRYTEQQPVGITKLTEQNLSVYPNPSDGKFHFGFGDLQSAKAELEIYNVLGEKVYYANNITQQTSTEIDLSDLSKGIYFVKLFEGTNAYTRKIIIQ